MRRFGVPQGPGRRRATPASAVAALRSCQDGFTLPELLIAITVLFTVVGVLATALIVGLRTTDSTATRLSESHDAQHTSAYLANDVQSARRISNTTCGVGAALINFSFDGASQVTSYRYAVVDGETRLTRHACNAGGTPVNEVVLSRFVSSATPTVTCDDLACDPVARPEPRKVVISVTEGSGFSFTLTGIRRAFTAAGPNGSPDGPFIGLAAPIGQDDEQKLHITKATVDIKGDVYVDCCLDGSADIDLMDLHPSDSRLLTPAGGLYLFDYPTLSGCVGCNATNVPGSWPPKSFSTHLKDPLAHLPYPSETGLPVFTGDSYQGPGVYRNELKITSNTTLASGIYILNKGLLVDGDITVTGSEVLLFNGCGLNAPGSCSNTDGKFQIKGKAGLTLSPLTSDPYGGAAKVLLFQHRSNPNEVKIELKDSTRATTLDGRIYAKIATDMAIQAGSQLMKIKGIVAPWTKFDAGTVQLGPL